MGSMDGFRNPDGWDSVIGREGQRGVDEWVFFDNDQLIACFLVDQLGVIPAKEALHAAIKKLHRPWPTSALEFEQHGVIDDAADVQSVAPDVGTTAPTILPSASTRWIRR